MEGLSEAQQYGRVEHDAMAGEHPVMFAYTCDMPRISRFNIGLRANRDTVLLLLSRGSSKTDL